MLWFGGNDAWGWRKTFLDMQSYSNKIHSFMINCPIIIIHIGSLVAVTLYYLCRRKLEHDYSKLAGKMDTDKAHLVEETKKLE